MSVDYEGVVGEMVWSVRVTSIICATSFDVTYSGVNLYVPEASWLWSTRHVDFVMFVRSHSISPAEL